MANEFEAPSFGSGFNIETFPEAGNQQLVNDLLAPETASGDPDKIEKIEEPKKEVKKVTPQKIEKKEEPKEEEKKEDPFKGFLEEEEEEEEEEPKKEEPKDDSEKEEPASNQFSALAKDLFKLNVFTKDEEEEEEEITTPEQFLERFNIEKQKGANQMIEEFIGRFGEDHQHAFQAIFLKGVDPKEYYGTYNTIQNFAEMDLTNETNQVAIVKQMLTDQGLDPEDVTSEIEKIKNYGDLEEKSQKYHKVLIKKEAAKLQQLELSKQQELEQKTAMKQSYIKNVQTILQEKLKAKEFDGIPLNPKQANELQDFLVTDKWKTPSGETLTDFDRTILDLKKPENHSKKIKVALLLKLLETDPTLSTIQRTGITKKTNELFGEVARVSQKSSVKSSSKEQPKSWFS